MKINYNHLYYFWEMVRQGGVAQAAEALHLTPQTVSGQLKEFQAQFPEQLLVRTGRRLQLSPLGERVYEHADNMFENREYLVAMMDRGTKSTFRRLRIGAADSLPKTTVRELLTPAMQLRPRPLLSVREVELSLLLEDLAYRRLDAVIADRPTSTAAHARARSHLLLTSDIGVYAAEPLHKQLAPGFPQSLDGAPALLPARATYMRRLLDQWFHENDIHPEVVGEMEDSALIKSFGEVGFGFFAAPADQANAIAGQHRARLIGRCEGIQEQFFVVTLESGPTNPVVEDWLASMSQ